MKCADVIQHCKKLPYSSLKPLNKSGTQIAFVIDNNASIKEGRNTNDDDVLHRAFAYFETGAPIQWQFTVCVTEELFETLQSPPRIRAADKPQGHWVTIARVENYPDEELLQLIDWSYKKALAEVENLQPC